MTAGLASSASVLALCLAVPQALASAVATADIRDGTIAVDVKGLPSAWHGKTLQFLPELAGVIDNAAKPESRWQDGVWRARVPLR